MEIKYAKNNLREFCQRKGFPMPIYNSESDPKSPPHKPLWNSSVIVGKVSFTGIKAPGSKKAIENCIAFQALQIILSSSSLDLSTEKEIVVDTAQAFPTNQNCPENVEEIAKESIPISKEAIPKEIIEDYKSKLQILCQKRKFQAPIYVAKQSGPSHDSEFFVTVTLHDGSSFTTSNAQKSKRNAEREAARLALAYYKERGLSNNTTLPNNSFGINGQIVGIVNGQNNTNMMSDTLSTQCNTKGSPSDQNDLNHAFDEDIPDEHIQMENVNIL